MLRNVLIKQYQPFCGVSLQLCVVSIVGLILYCITYVPDERTSMQFIVKVRLHTHSDSILVKTEVVRPVCDYITHGFKSG